MPIRALAQEEPAADVAKLAALVESGGPHAEILAVCKRLALVGDASCVATLAPLLADEQLSHPARIALEAIPDPAAGAALRASLSQVKGDLLVGVINSLGVRRDRQAVADLGDLLRDSDPCVARAAASTLGKIAGSEATQRLEESLPEAPLAVRPAVANALLACSEALVRQGSSKAAIAVYDHLRKADLPEQIVLAATKGAILTRGTEGATLLADELAAPSNARIASALGIARELADVDMTKLLVDQLSKLPADRQALLIMLFGERKDVAARPAIVGAMTDSSRDVRLAAIKALATVGDASTLPVLLEAALSTDPEIAATAVATLGMLPDPEVGNVVADRIATSEGALHRVLVEIAGRRRLSAAVPALTKAADSTDNETRLAAIRALGQTIDPQQIRLLADRLPASAADNERDTVQQALKTACRRCIDEDRCAEALVGSLGQGKPEDRCFLLELLGSIGGSFALNAVAANALDQDEAIQDAATRVLGEWPTADAAPVLLDVAAKTTSDKYRIRTLRGAIRILRQMDMPDDRKIAMCRTAMDLAGRDQERALTLEALGRIPSADALTLVLPYLNSPPLNEPACSAAVSIGEKTLSTQRAMVLEAMQKVLPTAKNDELRRRAQELLTQAEKKASESNSPEQ